MKFTETPLSGAFLVDLERMNDERGYFARSFCKDEFARLGLDPTCMQCNVSFNKKKGTVRGMHFQVEPRAEAKLVRVTRGAIFDVIVDLRPDSATYLKSFGVELTEENSRGVYIPKGFAHGFQTLLDETEVFYQMFEMFSPAHSSGVRWDDPAFEVRWPLPISVISEKDRAYPDLVVVGKKG